MPDEPILATAGLVPLVAVVTAVVAVVAATIVILYIVRKLTPEVVKFHAVVTRWVSLQMEIKAPDRQSALGPGPGDGKPSSHNCCRDPVRVSKEPHTIPGTRRGSPVPEADHDPCPPRTRRKRRRLPNR